MSRGFSSHQGLITIIGLIVLILIQFYGAIISPGEAVRALTKQGYSDIEIKSHHYLLVPFRGCGSADVAKFIANVTNANKVHTEVFVCIGWLKGATVRTD